jgi:hypothetical protein
MALSCAVGTWDGADPPRDHGTLCRSVGRKMNTLGSTTGSELESEMIGLAANLVTPSRSNSLVSSGMSTASTTSWKTWRRVSAPTQATTASQRNKSDSAQGGDNGELPGRRKKTQ